jgi:GntR family transcriptional regulator/MocR family aminotransferase
VAPPALLARFAILRRAIDRQGDPAVERAVAELLADGVIDRHVKRVRRIYRARRDTLAATLQDQLPDAVRFALPPGGMALWVDVARGLDVDAWAARCLRAGVHFLTARAFAFDGRPRPAARLGYAYLTEPELREAVARMRAAL